MAMRYQPQGLTRVSQRSGLAAGLAGFWTPFSGKAIPQTGANKLIASRSIGFTTSGASDFWVASPTAVISGSPTWTILAVLTGTTGNGNGGGVALYCERPNDTQITKLGFGNGGSGQNGPLLTVRDQQGNLVNMTGLIDVRTDTGAPRVIVGTRRAANDHRVYVGGKLDSSVGTTVGGTFGSTNATIGNDPYDTGSNLTGTAAVPLVMVWTRSLSDAEIAKISANPWQLFDSGSASSAYQSAIASQRASAAVGASLSGGAQAVALAFGSLTTMISIAGGAVGSASPAGALNVDSNAGPSGGNSTPTGSLSMNVVSAGTTTTDLTAAGKVDWLVYNGPGAPLRKNGSASLINVYHVGDFTDSLATDSKETATWSDGAGTVSGSTNDLLFSSTGDGIGYSTTFPADTTPRIATVIAGVYNTRMRITASLSDGSAATVVDTSIVSDSSGGNPAIITIQYAAASAGQTLTVTTVQIAPSGYANSSFQAAAMSLAAVAASLSGNSQGIASPAAALTTAIPLAGAASGKASPAASLTSPVSLAGSAQGQASPSASLTTRITLTSAASGVASPGATLTTRIAFSGAAQGIATPSAALSAGNPGLSGSALGSATGAASLTTAIALTGSGQGMAVPAAVLSISTAGLAGSARGQGSGAAILTAPVSMAGSAQGHATGLAALTTGGSIAGGAAGQASGSATLTTGISLMGAASGQAQPSASLGSVAASLSGAAAGKALGSAQLTVSVSLAGAQQAQAEGRAALSAQIALVAIAQARASASATLSTSISLAGHARAVSIATGDLSMGVKYARAPAGTGYAPHSSYNETRPAATSAPRPAATQRNFR